MPRSQGLWNTMEEGWSVESGVDPVSVPTLPGHSWRPLGLDDALALHLLELECAPVDGLTSPTSTEGCQEKLQEEGEKLATDTLCAVDSDGRLAAVAWVTWDDSLAHERRAFLDGRVHPDYRGRGLGAFILEWMETRGRQMLSALERDRPAMLRIDFYDRSDDARALFEKQGFRFSLAEDELRRDLRQALPATELPEGITVATWSPQTSSFFFQVYQDAFRERPRFPGWSEEVWRCTFAAGATFRPDLSILVLQGSEPVGFAVCHVETEETQAVEGLGWIAQMGIRPAWRNQGLGGALLSEVMRRTRAGGLRWAGLEVNIDNDKALRLYRRLGFELLRRRTSCQKPAR
jgi:mycothiol synthase